MSSLADIVALPFFAQLDEETRQFASRAARLLVLPTGSHVFDPGQIAEAFLIVAKGTVRVQLTAENGREIVLYRVEAGESCVLTTSGLIDAELHAAEAVCETDVEAVALPRASFRKLLAESTGFRDAVLAAYAARVSDLILTIEETRFRRIDARLAELLGQRGGARIAVTHHELAVELGTAREVISRVLKRFERVGAITLGRGWVDVTDSIKLAQQAHLV